MRKGAFMTILLPKKTSFSLYELPEYLEKTYQVNLTYDDLIRYARDNKLKTCIRLEGNSKGLYSVGRIKLDEQEIIPVCYPPTAVYFNSISKKTFLPHDFHLEDNNEDNVFFGARIPIINVFYQEIQKGNLDYFSAAKQVKANISDFIEPSYLSEYEHQLLLIPEKFSFAYSANFYLPREVYNISTHLLNSHLITIDFTDDSFYLLENTNRKNIFVNLAIKISSARAISVHFKDIEVLHSDLMDFLGIDEKPLENTADLYQQIEKLQAELVEKDSKIAQLQTALDDKNVPILLGMHRSDDPLKIAIEVRNKYWASYPDNVKSNTQIRDYIIRDYSVTKTFATEIEKIACPIDRKKN